MAIGFAKLTDTMPLGDPDMAWPPKVKENLLVQCGRYCCVCHKYCGTKIEIDHIIPESDGGPSTEDNGIPVCFDCHADIKHYNDKHPRGTKFRADELRRHRERLFYLVKSGEIYRIRALHQSATIPEQRDESWSMSQASTICAYEFPYFVPVHDGKTDTDISNHFFERLQQIIALANWVTATTTPYDDFVYLLTTEEVKLPVELYTAIRTELYCHLTKFVAVFQAKCEQEFEHKEVELPPEMESAPDDIELEMNAGPGRFVPHRISRTGPKSVWLRELASRPRENPPVDTTSGMLAILHGMLTNKCIVWDDFKWTDETRKAMSFMAAVSDKGEFSFSQITLDRNNPEYWEGPSVDE